MEKVISRTFSKYQYTCKVFNITDGKLEDKELLFDKELDGDNALKIAKKTYDNDKQTVCTIDIKTGKKIEKLLYVTESEFLAIAHEMDKDNRKQYVK